MWLLKYYTILHTSSNIDWNDVIKKETRGIDENEDLGEVQDIGQEFVVTERGRLNKRKFYLPKN